MLHDVTISLCKPSPAKQLIRSRSGEPSRNVRTLNLKLGSYKVLKTLPPDTPEVANLRVNDRTDNNILDTSLVAELTAGRVDALVTEDRGIHRKAAIVGLSSAVFTIDSFLEKVTAENPALADYNVLALKKTYFGHNQQARSFFDSFRNEYPGFDGCFNRKADESACGPRRDH